MLKIDLHTHSTFSDGTLSPYQLVRRAKKGRVSILSLTDHDTLDGLPEFDRACRRYGIKGIRGIELSAQYPSTLHILGYRIDENALFLEKELVRILQHRDFRNQEILTRLSDLGMPVSYTELQNEAGGNVIARPHFARIMVRKGYVKDIHTAFQNYLSRGAAAYAERVRLTPDECINAIRRSGGLPVLAHPGQTTKDKDKLFSLLTDLKEKGLWGLECIYPGHSPRDILDYLKMASALSLYPTAGSDFHGTNRQGIDMGMVVRDDLLPWARLCVSL
jgi:predicted metal-dependent phosphoesterase TrpH